MADTEITRIESMIQSAEAFGSDLAKADECAEGIIGIREERNETAGSLREVLYRLEAETTPRVIEMARRVFSGYGNDEFSLNIHMHNEAEAGIPRLSPYDHVDIDGNGIIRIEAYSADAHARMIAVIRPNETHARKKIMRVVPLWKRILSPNVKLKYKYGFTESINENWLHPKDTFQLIAGKYSDGSEEKSLLDTYVEMYAKLPQLIARIGEGLKRKEESRKSGLETSIGKIAKLAGEQ